MNSKGLNFDKKLNCALISFLGLAIVGYITLKFITYQKQPTFKEQLNQTVEESLKDEMMESAKTGHDGLKKDCSKTSKNTFEILKKLDLKYTDGCVKGKGNIIIYWSI